MRTARTLASLAGIAAPVLLLAAAAAADTMVWGATRGVTSLTISRLQLEAVGLSLDRVERASREDVLDVGAPTSDRYSFVIPQGAGLAFRTRDGSFTGFVDGSATFPVEGGLELRVTDPRLPASEISLNDFSIELSPADDGLLGVIRGGTRAPLFEIRNAGPAFHAATSELVVLGGDLVLSREWAQSAGRPELAGEWMGTFDLRLRSEILRREGTLAPSTQGTSAVSGIDVLLKEVYGMNDLGRTGTYPNGKLGLSFATTSCNNGDVNVPWHAPMAEDHPFIGLMMCRLSNGRLEMIGKSWLKHGFYALASDQCGLGCIGGSGGGYLMIGCSDTYSISNNGSQYYLGGRDEVNPHTCVWHCLGSWFDGTPVDCVRSNDGIGLDGVAHRLEVFENELTVPGARYFYEGVYYVMDDVDPVNNFMWREVTPSWTGSAWNFTDVGGGLYGTPGLLIESWGDKRHSVQVAADDGFVVISEQVTDLGGGSWHYEYALYNQSSDRGVRTLSIPIGTTTVSNVGFRDVDRNGANQWTFDAGNGLATWSTFAHPGPSNPLVYQTLYNFWFDAPAPPQAAQARLGLYKPGTGDVVFVEASAPQAGATAAIEPGLPAQAFMLYPCEPNPFAGGTQVSFALGRERAVRLTIVDVGGRLVKTLLDGTAPSGRTSLRWDGRDNAGAGVASGIYFFRLESAKDARTTNGILLR